MPSTVALTMSKWSLDLATKLIKADVRLHNAQAIRDDMAIIFVVNHFTRLETLLLPYEIYRHTGKEVWSLAAADLFKGQIGQFLQSTGTISNKDPDRDTIIVKSLLEGKNPWIIFPEGAMIKDKKVIDHTGEFSVFNNGARRAPHKGAAVLALRAEFYRHKLQCIHDRPGQEGLDKALAHFGLEKLNGILSKRTVIVPVNITYFPMRAHDNLLLRMATRFAKDLSKRALEELSVEGTVLSEDTDIDIELGEPIDVQQYLNAPEYAELMACSLNDMQNLEMDAGSLFQEAARQLMQRYMRDIYQLTTVNYDHIFATLIRHMQQPSFTERSFRNRVYLCAHQLGRMTHIRKHSLIGSTYAAVVYEEPSQKFSDFMALCLREGVLTREGDTYTRNPAIQAREGGFHEARWEELTDVIANEIEPLTDVTEMITQVARMPRFLLSKRVRDIINDLDQQQFEENYFRFYTPEFSKGQDVGRPFLLKPMHVKAGIVLAHGYMAGPLEIRPLAEYLYEQGFAVYGVRLAGHGTAPEDLARTQWEEWYESYNRGYAIIKSLTDDIVLGGFSTGGCLALMAAARKGIKVQAVFSICAPLTVRSYSIKFAPGVLTVNSIIQRFSSTREGWRFVENMPENPHINYTRNPVASTRELMRVMNAMESALPQVTIPSLIVQASKDTVVHPSSGQQIFDGIGATHKQYTLFERDRHNIINGAGRDDIFERVSTFIERAPRHQTVQSDMELESRHAATA